MAMLHLLAEGPREVNRIARELDISQPNASQHLSVMRAANWSRPSATVARCFIARPTPT
ncbi:MAG: ArsR family transcriptional regulator [Chloroflexota bacterium]